MAPRPAKVYIIYCAWNMFAKEPVFVTPYILELFVSGDGDEEEAECRHQGDTGQVDKKDKYRRKGKGRRFNSLPR